MEGHDNRLKSEQESQQNQRSTNTTPAPVLGLRTVTYCTENEGTPECRKDKDVIDETPAAYKDIDAVMQAQKDLVEVVHTLKQVVCVKG